MRMQVRWIMLVWLAVASAGVVLPLLASQADVTPRKLLTISVTGNHRFNTGDIVAASGLAPGMTAGEDDFRKAAERLGDTGAFSDVSYSYTYSEAGTKLTFDIKEHTEFVPARFEDFVWFSDEEIRHQIKERVPLFDGELPVSGKLAAQVSDVLQGMLIEKGLSGHVDYDRLVKEEGGNIQAVLFSVQGVSILVRRAQVTGAGADELAQMQAVSGLSGKAYTRSGLELFVEKQILPVFREHGYIKAEVKILPPKTIPPQSESPGDRQNATYVDVEFITRPGNQYQIAGIEWDGNKIVPVEQLNALLRAKPGKTANSIQLAADLDRVRQLYASQGYIRTAIKPEEQFDEPSSSVKYRLKVVEDSQYKMGELEIRGLDRALEAKVIEAWKLHPGAVYNAGYLPAFLQEAVKLLTKSLDWTTTHHVTANVRDKTVDVEIHFTAQATRQE